MLKQTISLTSSIISNINKRLITLSANCLSVGSHQDTVTHNKASGKGKDFQGRTGKFDIKGLQNLGLIKDKWSWPKYNRIIYPPQSKDEPPRNAFVHHMRTYIKYPAKKLWYPATMIRGMTIDEAIKQMTFHYSKGAQYIKETLLEAQELAVNEHNIEFKSNLWVSYSSTTQAMIVKGVRKHAGPRFGMVKYRYSNYYVRLEEGKPPQNFYPPRPSFQERAEQYIDKLRKREITHSI